MKMCKYGQIVSQQSQVLGTGLRLLFYVIFANMVICTKLMAKLKLYIAPSTSAGIVSGESCVLGFKLERLALGQLGLKKGHQSQSQTVRVWRHYMCEIRDFSPMCGFLYGKCLFKLHV